MIKVSKSRDLSWVVKISWSKNATLPILWAAILVNWKITLKNVPKIWDVLTFLSILEWIWVTHNFEWDTLYLDSSNINSDNLDLEKIKKIRASILLLPPILHFFWKISIPMPGWCQIWKRPIDSHLNWLKNIWYKFKYKSDHINLNWELESWDKVLNAQFWVTSTENLIVANVLREWTTTIMQSATEPHVMNLIDFLRKAWADIKVRYDHEIIITWVKKLIWDFQHEIVSDYIESGTFMIIWALASKKYIEIESARLKDLYAFIEKLKMSWVEIEDLWWDRVRVHRCKKISPVDIQTNIYPGFPTDLQSPFTVLQTQGSWISRVHEILFESRLNFLVELETLWAEVIVENPHQAIIKWKTKLKWATVTSWDLRAWAAMVIAGLIASWETQVTKVEYIYRWYQNFVEKLQKLWAKIEKI